MDTTLAIILIVVAAVVGIVAGVLLGIAIYSKKHKDAKQKIETAETEALRIYNGY